MWNMFISNLGCHAERGRNHSISQVQIKTPKIHELQYVLEFKTHASRVLVSLIAGWFRQ